MSAIELTVVDPVIHLLQATQAARERAEHYSGFKVGATGWISFRASPKVKLLRPVCEGANIKRTPDAQKYCAEMVLMDYAEEHGIVYDLWLIVGQPRKEDIAPTLHPCEVCRDRMRKLMQAGKALRPTSMIVCVDAIDENICETFTAKELLDFYDSASVQ